MTTVRAIVQPSDSVKDSFKVAKLSRGFSEYFSEPFESSNLHIPDFHSNLVQLNK